MGILILHDGENIPTLKTKHDPDSTKLYYVVWDDLMSVEGDTPAAVTPSAWEVSPAGSMTVDSNTQPGTQILDGTTYDYVTSAMLTVGTAQAGDIVTVTNRLTTTAGQIIDRSFKLGIGET